MTALTTALTIIAAAALLSSCAERKTGWQRSWWTGEQIWVSPLGDNDGGIHK